MGIIDMATAMASKVVQGLAGTRQSAEVGKPEKQKTFLEKTDDWMSFVVKLWLYLLEIAGITYVLKLSVEFNVGLQLIKAGSATGFEYVKAVKVAAESTNSIIVGLCIVLPGLIAFLKTGKNIMQNYYGGSGILPMGGMGMNYSSYSDLPDGPPPSTGQSSPSLEPND